MIITREDVRQYVVDTLPYTELEDWNIDGIVDAMVGEWTLIGQSGVDHELHLGPSRAISTAIDSERYWRIVQDHQHGR